MRILQIITNLGTGGAEKLLVDSVPLYIEKGIDMDLLLLNGKEYPFSNQLKSRNTNYISLGNSSVYNPLLVFKIIPFLKKYDIVHVHLFPTLYWVAIAKIISLSRTKLIFTEHNTSNNRMNKFIWRLLDKLMYSKYSKIISITEEVQTAIKNHLKINDQALFCIIQNGIDLSCYENSTIKESQNIQDGEKIIIQVSSFREQKDQKTLIKALQLLPENIILNLVGEGIMKSDCEKLVSELKLTNRVNFLGVRTDIPELLQMSDIAVLSSHYEGFGLSAVEGMASKTPFIASDVPGLNTVVGGAGILFSPGDERALADKIKNLLSDKQYYYDTAKACRERANKYDINIMVDKYIYLYKSIL
jgi:glycosyltransferase involved in cell wall biosynthesis